jgi:hypothetical protein
MANVYHPTTNTWVIDTAGAGVIDSRHLKISSIRWVGATTAGHQVVVNDAAGGRVWSTVAAGANNVEANFMGEEKWANGLIVPTLQSGYLEIILA